MYTDLTFNQAKMAVDKMSVFDQHQILDGLYQDVVSDDSNGNLYIREDASPEEI